MSKKDFIQVFEHQKLKYDDKTVFTEKHFNTMVQFNEKNHNKYFTIIHKGILFNSYVGVIQVGKLTIEILPKADKSDNPDKSTWQSVLINMLRVCKKINIDNVSETNLKKKYNSILDVYYEMYVLEVERILKQGVIKKYRKLQENQFALKGKLMFAKNLEQNLTHKERFFCEHQVYDKNHLLHQIIFSALHIVKDLGDSRLKSRVVGLIHEFEFCNKVEIKKEHFKKLVLGRKEVPYTRAIEIAKMLILNYSPSLNSGNTNMLTLLFDMNKLWEEYIFRVLYRHKPKEHTVSFQSSTEFWEKKKIRPDIVYIGDETVVIDTKWKVVDASNPSDDDLKQMFTYNLHWEAEKSILLYPLVNQQDSFFGVYKYNNLGKKCKLAFISLTEGTKLKPGKLVANDIIDKFLDKKES
ncbi:restriction endonuclease [Flavobacterium rakeshii]|uniref:McrC family protein n=1 Tax=Flavobacterium rakeshii TaxID=1038845 RepID=UPI002E7B173A|nr:restriction endonuclease [Flavobacterium rakeshii]MEE1897978.1 restriction endonuclease [Flavobacterium rakeshii]